MASTLIKQGISFIKEKKSMGNDIKFPRKFADSEDSFKPTGEIPRLNAEILEGKFGIKNVEIIAENSGFTYFLDGIERKKVFSYWNSIPVIYGYVAGVILKRTDKQLHAAGMEISKEAFFLPVKKANDAPEHYFSEEDVKGLEKNIINIGIKDKKSMSYPMLPEQFIQAAHSRIQTIRNEIEGELARAWVESSYEDGWLFVDGRLENKNKELISGKNIAGIVKSHHASYFDNEDQYKIYCMEKGQRSSVFQPVGENGQRENIYSWYLKLHHNKNYGDNSFGLVRVEVPAEEDYLSKVDQISSWILLETKPVALPASRWDRMVYPIKYCEDYLKSKAPSYTLINSLH